MLAELYDPARGVFTSTQPPVFQQFAHTATLIPGGLVLLAGGWSMAGPTASMQVFDSVSGRFESLLSPLPIPRQLHEATLLPDGTVLFTGGASTNGQRIPVVERFLTASRGLLPLPPLLVARAEHTATLLNDGRILIVGGTSGTDQGIIWWRSAELYSMAPLP
jgi:hypothetical protein